LSKEHYALELLEVERLRDAGDWRSLIAYLGSSAAWNGATVRAAASRALGTIEARGAASALTDLLKDEDAGVRTAAVKALGSMQAESTVTDIGRLAKADSSPRVREWAVWALAVIGGPDSRTWLGELSRSSDKRMRFAVIRALRRHGGPAESAILRSIETGGDLRLSLAKRLAIRDSRRRYGVNPA